METYEITYIISNQLKSQEAESLSNEIESFIKEGEGVILKSEKISIKTLAYPIKKQASGYFVSLEFKIAKNKIQEIKEKLEKNVNVIRHIVLVKKPFKEMKKLRTRKTPVLKTGTPEVSSVFKDSKKGPGEFDFKKIDEKIEEILSE